MPRYRLTVAYDGTRFHGWQKQHPPGEEPLRTAQGVLEDAVRVAMREPICLLGASRTDAGVHAMGQVAAFTSEGTIDPLRLPAAISSRLPADIRVREAEIVPHTFNPISDCTSKGYRYVISHGCDTAALQPLFDRNITGWSAYRLDVDRMNEAAQHLIGEHDFASFTRLHHGRESTVRTVHDCTVTAIADDRLAIDVSGSGFLYNMVRIIAGTLVQVGRGAVEPAKMPAIIEGRDRRLAGATLRPEGLMLMWVRY